MRHLSLFSGIGGFDLGFDRAGMVTVGQVEIDPACRSVLERHWPNVQRWEDVSDVRGAELPAFDVLTGGFPCQDISVAGRRAGLAGERSGLWYEFARLIAETRPRWLVIENVPGLLSSHRGRDLGTILRFLGEHGYGFAYRVLDAQWFGVAQRRRRVFIVGHLGGDGASQVLDLAQGSSGDPRPSRQAGPGDPRGVARSLGGVGGGQDFGANKGTVVGWEVTPEYGQGSDLRARPTEVASPLTLNPSQRPSGDRGTWVGVDLFNQTLTGDLHVPLRTAGGHGAPAVANTLTRRMGKGVNTTMDEGQTIVGYGLSENQRAELRLTDISRSIVTGGGKAGQGYPAAQVGQTIRRLTPTECARLQGFPDDWNDHLKDAARYRQYGNAVCTNVTEWIGRRIAAFG